MEEKLRKRLVKIVRGECAEAGMPKVNVAVSACPAVVGWPLQIVVEVRADIDPSQSPDWIYN